ncbi:MAG: hypothetical protein M1832_005012 [Thelocarpon impressellum]|nr:MAG: hypothetical protein M1832_005012 [Thelocarpon impressellum]
MDDGDGSAVGMEAMGEQPPADNLIGPDVDDDAAGLDVMASPRVVRRAVESVVDGEPGRGSDVGVDQRLDGNKSSAFERLPVEIIEQVLYDADVSSFASLLMVNRDWHRAAQSAHLYAHQLSRCPSYALSNSVIPGPFQETDLPRLRRRFEAELRRNLFDAYLRPRETVIKVVSDSANSYASFPGGEAFRFSFSPSGRFVLAFGSCRIYILDVSTPTPSVTRELKVLRRPVSIDILDDGSKLAVLSSDHQVNIYDLRGRGVRLLRSVPLDNPPRSIVLSPGGSVLAAAYDGGIEVYSLAEQALPTDRRSVKCNTVDALSFSSDGTLLIGTTLQNAIPNTVTLFAPYQNEGEREVPVSELLSQMWTTQILFPNASRACSHSTLLPHRVDGEMSWIFTYDTTLETFRVVRLEDLRSGEQHFTGPTTCAKLSPALSKSLPAASPSGELVAVGFAGQQVWLFGVPEDLGRATDPFLVTGFIGNSGTWIPNSTYPSNAHDTSRPPMPGSTGSGIGPGTVSPNLQGPRSVSHHRSMPGYNIGTVEGMTALRWLRATDGAQGRADRLVVVAPGGVDGGGIGGEAEAVEAIDGGRIVVFDFERGARDGKRSEITVEVGEGEAELLEEETREMDVEVALVRQRTVVQRSGALGGPPRPSLSRAATFDSIETLSAPVQARRYPGPATSEAARRSHAAFPVIEDGLSLEEVQEAYDGPYSHTNPRSRTTLHRAATAAATSVRSGPRALATQASGVPSHFTRRQVPHESDADNWVPPPPPYQADADAPLPEHLRATLLPRRHVLANRAQTHHDGLAQSALQRTRTLFARAGGSGRRERRLSEGDERRSPSPRPPTPAAPPVAVPAREVGDLYSASPLSSPTRSNVAESPVASANVEMPIGSPGSIRSMLASPFPSLPQQLHEPELTPQPSPRPSPQRTSESAAAPAGATRAVEQPTLELSFPSPISTTFSGSTASDPWRMSFERGGPVTLLSSVQATRSPEVRSPGDLVPEASRISPVSQLDESDALAPPSPQQLASLKQRHSRPSDLILSRPRSAAGLSTGRRQSRAGAAQSPAQPRPSSSLDNLRSNPRRRSREGRFLSTGESSPNLSRPDFHRLDTIQSVASQQGSSLPHPMSSDGERGAPSIWPAGLGNPAKKAKAKSVWRRRERDKQDKDRAGGVRASGLGGKGEAGTDVGIGNREVEDEGRRAGRCRVM